MFILCVQVWIVSSRTLRWWSALNHTGSGWSCGSLSLPSLSLWVFLHAVLLVYLFNPYPSGKRICCTAVTWPTSTENHVIQWPCTLLQTMSSESAVNFLTSCAVPFPARCKMVAVAVFCHHGSLPNFHIFSDQHSNWHDRQPRSIFFPKFIDKERRNVHRNSADVVDCLRFASWIEWEQSLCQFSVALSDG